ncbi:MAG: transposase [Myxococcales bacterium]|nr:transposase [Myxococcales bacterium]
MTSMAEERRCRVRGNHRYLTEPLMRHAGIDVSKSTLSVALLEPAWSVDVPNTPAGIDQIAKRLRSRRRAGPHAQHRGDGRQSPATRNFAKAIRQRGKTNRADSQMLARFASSMEFVPWTPPSAAAKQLREVMRRRKQLVDQMATEKRRLVELRCWKHRHFRSPRPTPRWTDGARCWPRRRGSPM